MANIVQIERLGLNPALNRALIGAEKKKPNHRAEISSINIRSLIELVTVIGWYQFDTDHIESNIGYVCDVTFG